LRAEEPALSEVEGTYGISDSIGAAGECIDPSPQRTQLRMTSDRPEAYNHLTHSNTRICAPIPAQVSSRTSRGDPVRDGI
jgi:hypothetical protein